MGRDARAGGEGAGDRWNVDRARLACNPTRKVVARVGDLSAWPVEIRCREECAKLALTRGNLGRAWNSKNEKIACSQGTPRRLVCPCLCSRPRMSASALEPSTYASVAISQPLVAPLASTQPAPVGRPDVIGQTMEKKLRRKIPTVASSDVITNASSDANAVGANSSISSHMRLRTSAGGMGKRSAAMLSRCRFRGTRLDRACASHHRSDGIRPIGWIEPLQPTRA